MNKPGIILVGHAGLGNRGCEAIVKCTVASIKKVCPKAEISLVSSCSGTDREICGEFGIKVFPSDPFPLSLLTGRPRAAVYKFLKLHNWRSNYKRRLYRSNNTVMSIGGDNITGIDVGRMKRFILDLKFAKEMGLKTVLWGATVDPFDRPDYNELVLPVLKRLDLIVARDHETRDNLVGAGVDSGRVVFAPDPAFELEATVTDRIKSYIDWTREKPTLGVSLSQLLLNGLSLKGGDFQKRIKVLSDCLGRWISESTQRVILIPHVVMKPGVGADDYKFSNLVIEEMGRPYAVRIMPGHLRASEYKAVIGSCEMFMGARMHATIAAVSQAVPSLSLSYSRKSGAMQQMLLAHKRFSCNFAEMDANGLLCKIRELYSEREEIKNQLTVRLVALKEDYERMLFRFADVLGCRESKIG